ncbi:MAG TPA: efflux RND transporter periplasmic adaptor subunit [Polyangiaceae bacterium]|nr:efflux RND transporter periplasmic adaptor subunit [Polyangiaceae bacterium]
MTRVKSLARGMADQLSNDLASLKLNRDAPQPASGLWKKLLWVGVLGATAAGVYFAIPQLEARLFKPEVQVTEIMTLSPAQASVKLTSSGYIVAQESSEVGPVVAGRVKEIKIKEGEQVQLGQVIAILENADRKAAISAARSQIATAGARAEVAKADLAAAKIKLAREQALVKEGISAPAVDDDLAAQTRALQKQVEASESQVKAARSEVKNLQVNLDYMTVTAPINGTVIGKPAGVGAMVGPFVGASAKLVDLDSIMIETDVPEGRVHLLERGAPTEIVLDAFPNKRWRGEVAQIGPRVDRAKATVTVKVRFVDKTDGVLPEMAARVNFLEKKLDEATLKAKAKVVVPKSAVTERSGAKVVFVIDNGKVRMRTVRLGEEVGTGFELLEGPPDGARVVRDPPPELEDGRDVKEGNNS